MQTNRVFAGDATTSKISSKLLPIKIKDIESHVIKVAINSFASFNFATLKRLYPQLKSIREFITSDDYLANVCIKVSGSGNILSDYSQYDKLQIAKTVLKQIESILITRGKTYRGTKDFFPYMFKDKFRDTIQLNVTIPTNSDKEFGVSMRTPRNPMYALDLSTIKWYAHNDNYGTSEEKALVKYIEGIMPKLEEKYDEIYLVRNEKDVKIYSFDNGQVFEPDFLLFLRIKGSKDKYDNIQLFIEPKGDGLLKQDKWENDFLKQIKSMSNITYCTNADAFIVWGIPFFNESSNREFETAINDDVMGYLSKSPITHYELLSYADVPEEKNMFSSCLYIIYMLLVVISRIIFPFLTTKLKDGWTSLKQA